MPRTYEWRSKWKFCSTPEKAEGEATETPAAESEENKEPEEVFKTLDQYFAEKAKPAAEVSIRRANEGADEAQWKDAVVLKKEDEELFADLAKVKIKLEWV